MKYVKWSVLCGVVACLPWIVALTLDGGGGGGTSPWTLSGSDVHRVSGNVGIGTSSPTERLEIEGDDATTTLQINNTASVFGISGLSFALDGTKAFTMGVDDANDKFKIGTTSISTDTRFTIDAAGRTGIGTASPIERLDIEDESSRTTLQINNTSGVFGKVSLDFALDGTKTFSIGVDDVDKKFKIGTSAFDVNTRFAIDSSGNIGIGTINFDGTAAGVIAIADGTAPAVGNVNKSYLYARNVGGSSEMHVMNGAGDEIQIQAGGTFPAGYEVVKITGTTANASTTNISYTPPGSKIVMGFHLAIHSVGLDWIPHAYGDPADQAALHFQAQWAGTDQNQFALSKVGTSLRSRNYRLLIFLTD